MKLLLVDDDTVARTALREIIGSPPGWEILEAEDGQAALDQLCDGLRADLLIIDLRMPRLDGVELLQRLRRDLHLRNLKVVVSSSVRDRDTIVRLSSLKISGYLLKPYDAPKVRALLQPLLPPAPVDPLLASRDLLARTALVVDDDPATAAAWTAAQARVPDWRWVVARDAGDALERLRAGERPDLLVSGLAPTTPAGADLIRRVRVDLGLAALRIVALAAPDPATAAAWQRQRVSFVPKPLDSDKLVGLLRGSPGPDENATS